MLVETYICTVGINARHMKYYSSFICKNEQRNTKFNFLVISADFIKKEKLSIVTLKFTDSYSKRVSFFMFRLFQKLNELSHQDVLAEQHITHSLYADWVAVNVSLFCIFYSCIIVLRRQWGGSPWVEANMAQTNSSHN